MRVLVVGAGGVGGYFGAKLARVGTAVTFLARGAHLEAMRRDGLRIRSTVDGEWVVKADAVGDVSGGPVADIVLFCVKSFDTESAAEAIRPAVGPDTAVVSLQNGVDNEETLDRAAGRRARGRRRRLRLRGDRRPRRDRPQPGRPRGLRRARRPREPRVSSGCARPSPRPACPPRSEPTSGAVSGRSTS